MAVDNQVPMFDSMFVNIELFAVSPQMCSNRIYNIVTMSRFTTMKVTLLRRSGAMLRNLNANTVC